MFGPSWRGLPVAMRAAVRSTRHRSHRSLPVLCSVAQSGEPGVLARPARRTRLARQCELGDVMGRGPHMDSGLKSLDDHISNESYVCRATSICSAIPTPHSQQAGRPIGRRSSRRARLAVTARVEVRARVLDSPRALPYAHGCWRPQLTGCRLAPAGRFLVIPAQAGIQSRSLARN